MAQRVAYRKGFQAFEEGVAETDNPYNTGSSAFNQNKKLWYMGYYDARTAFRFPWLNDRPERPTTKEPFDLV